MVGRNFITQEELKEFSLRYQGRITTFSERTAYYYIRTNSIHLLDYGPMIVGATCSISTTDGEVYLNVESCKQCGKSEFDIVLMAMDEKINLLEIICEGKLL